MNVESKVELLTYTTLRIECLNPYDQLISTATGFIYAYPAPDDTSKHMLCLVTNKHVYDGTSKIRLTFPTENESYKIEIGCKQVMTLDESILKFVIFHPNKNIDLAILNVSKCFRLSEEKGNSLYRSPLDNSLLLSDDEWKSLDAMEEIIMIGYPNGLIDHVNNLPLIRKGITSSHPSYDFNGRKEFVIDAACFPGSSGSPVFLYNTGDYFDKANIRFNSYKRVKFLGILYAGPTSSAYGQVLKGEKTTTPIMLNLGYVIKANVLEDFSPLLFPNT